MDATLTSELIRQAPGLAAVVGIVVLFLKAQAQRDAFFLDAQEKRDAVWSATIERMAVELKAISQIVTAHDAAMKVTASNLEKGQKKANKK